MCRLRASVFSVGITDPKAVFKIAEIMMRFVPVLSACGQLRLFLLSERIRSDKFESLDANEKAAVESTLYRCRVLAAKIANELRNKGHFVDELSLADIHATLEHAADVLGQKGRRSVVTHLLPR